MRKEERRVYAEGGRRGKYLGQEKKDSFNRIRIFTNYSRRFGNA